MIIDFNNIEKIEDKDALVFYKNGAHEYAYIYPDDDNIYYIKKHDIYTFPKANMREFLLDRYNEISKQLLNADLFLKSEKSVPYFSIHLVRYKLPVIIYLSFIQGLKKTLDDFGVSYSISDKRDLSAYMNIPIKIKGVKKILNLFVKDKRGEYLVNGLKKIKINNFEFKDLNDREPFIQLIKKQFSEKAVRDLQLFEKKIIDPVTAGWLKEKNYPTSFAKLLATVMTDKLLNGPVENPNDPAKGRIRLGEAILDIIYAQLMQAARAVQEGTKSKLELDPKYIIEQLQKSGLIHYTKSMSPLEELSHTRKITKSGIGNMKADIIPLENRDIVVDSTIGIMSPTQSHEYTKIGVVHGMTMSARLKNAYGETDPKNIMSNDTEAHDVLSASELLTSPFINLNDQTRNVMGAQQASQFMELNNPDVPLVQTGYEQLAAHLVSDRFAKRAPCDGKIVEIQNNKFIKLKCKDGHEQLISIAPTRARTKRGVYMNKEYKVIVNKGQNVSENQPLAVSPSLSKGLITPGKNAVIAIMNYLGRNFEDGFVVSENFLNNFEFPKLEKISVVITPGMKIEKLVSEIGKETKQGETLIKFKYTNEFSDLMSNFEELEADNNGVLTDNALKSLKIIKRGEAEYTSPGGRITDIVLKINNEKNLDPKIKQLYKELIRHLKEIEDICKQTYKPGSKGFIDCAYSHENSEMLKIGGHKINGVEPDGAILEFYIEKPSTGTQSTKLVLGATGAKGTVQYIIPKDKTPYAEISKLPIDIIVSPLSIFARKSLAVNALLWAGKITYFVNLKAKQLAEKNDEKKLYKFLKDFYSISDKTPDQSILKSFEESWDPKEAIKQLKSRDPLKDPYYPMIVPPFKNNIAIKDLKQIADWLDIPLEEPVFMPEAGYSTDKPVAVGIIPVLVLEHLSESMANAVSVASGRSKLTGQGLSGQKEGRGSLSVGEYDLSSLMSSGEEIKPLIKEFTQLRSDDKLAEKTLIKNIIKEGEPPSQQELPTESSRTANLINTFMIAAGVQP